MVLSRTGTLEQSPYACVIRLQCIAVVFAQGVVGCK